MRINDVRSIITEDRTYRLWESVGYKLVEAQLTAAQIQQLFQQAEQQSTAAGDNRTAIGQIKDVGSSVAQAWSQLKSKVYNSQPMANFASAYDQAAEKLRQATGGDAGAMKYIQKYRDFATKHPILQGAIYAALVAAAGISSAGAGGAAAVGLLKMVDQAIQGKDIRSAAWSGAKTGAAAYAAGQVGKALQGGDQAAQATTGFGRTSLSTFQNDPTYGKQLATMIGDKEITPAWQNEFIKQLGKQAANPSDPLSMSQAWIQAMHNASKIAGNAYGPLKESQIRKVFYLAAGLQTQLNEGMWDTIKGAAGKAAGAVGKWAATKGHNITTVVTADKLMKAWQSAGSPTDSHAVAKIMRDAGVAEKIISRVISAVVSPLQQAKPKTPATTPATTTPGKKHTGGRVAGQVSQTPNAIRQRQARAAKKSATTAPSAGATAFGQMANQLQSTPNTTRTATGLVHRANPNNPNMAYAESYVKYVAESWDEYRRNYDANS